MPKTLSIINNIDLTRHHDLTREFDVVAYDLQETAGELENCDSAYITIQGDMARLSFTASKQGTTTTQELSIAADLPEGAAAEYLSICKTFYEKMKAASAQEFENIDIARRSIHNNGAKAILDFLVANDLNIFTFEQARLIFSIVALVEMAKQNQQTDEADFTLGKH